MPSPFPITAPKYMRAMRAAPPPCILARLLPKTNTSLGLRQLVGKECLTDIPHVHFHSTKGILNTIRNRTMFRWERRGLYWFLFFVWHIGIISPKTIAYRCLSWSIVSTTSSCGSWILWKCRLESLVDRGIDCFFIACPNYISRRKTYIARRETYIPRRATYISRRGIYFR